ncbi:MAG: thiolase domain-containing protein [Candidatus Thermoplasmatota archaeon]|nr:thiolase domain-containing protein [Candidatus Thermoplasmatota archaeon]
MRTGVIGIGHGKFGRREVTVQELAFEPFREALDDCGLHQKDLDALIVGSSPEYHRQRSLSGVVAEYLGMNPKPTFLVEAACASSSAALATADAYIRAGIYDTVAVLGVQKMLELSTPEILALMGRVGDVQWESGFGTTFPGYYAMFAHRHMYEYGTTREQMAAVAVKNHHYGAKNPNAMFQKEITAEKALASRMVASPLTLYDCCANADGAACMIVTNEETAKKADTPIWMAGLGSATAPMSVLRREKLSEIPSAIDAARNAYKMAGIEPKDVNVADVHDCFTIAEILAYEDLGFCEKGGGGKMIEEGETHIGGRIPVNVDGGLKSKGHPVGATGVSMAVEAVKQLRGEAGERQVDGAEVALMHNVGGIGQYCFVNILRR